MPDEASTVRVALFAGMAEEAGTRSVEVPWRGGTVRDLRQAVAAMFPAVELLLSKSAFAIGDRYAASDESVPMGADVAIIPPVSGG